MYSVINLMKDLEIVVKQMVAIDKQIEKETHAGEQWRLKKIKKALDRQYGTLLDIGTELGYLKSN